jgi:hypothetical protein
VNANLRLFLLEREQTVLSDCQGNSAQSNPGKGRLEQWRIEKAENAKSYDRDERAPVSQPV